MGQANRIFPALYSGTWHACGDQGSRNKGNLRPQFTTLILVVDSHLLDGLAYHALPRARGPW